MAFTKTPATDTYSTKEVRLTNVWESRNRTATKDNEALNVFYEFVTEKKTKDDDFFVVKRDGAALRNYYLDPDDGEVKGFYHWQDKDIMIIAQGEDLKFFTSSTGVPIGEELGIFPSGMGTVGFTEFLYSSGQLCVMATDGVKLVKIEDDLTVTECTDPDLPSPHLPYPQYLDGYLFLIKTGTADIYNSDLDDPMAWTDNSPITAEMLPDTAKRLGKLNNFLVVFGSASIEYFWDAGNATGSPLQKYDTPVKYIGYLGGYAEIENRIYFVGNSATATPDIYVMEDLKITSISDPVVRRYLVPLSSFVGNVVSNGGHDFYWLTAGGFTYVYDMDNKLWHRMSFQDQDDFPIWVAHTVWVSAVGNVTVFCLVNDTQFYSFDAGVFQDNEVDFPVRIITNPEFFDTYNRKFAGRISIRGDKTPASCIAEVSHTDDDYQTWTTAREVDLYSSIPKLERNGTFRRRAWKIEISSDNPVRLKQLDVEINMGQG